MLIKIILLRVFLFEEISLKGLGFDLAFILVLASLIELIVPKKLTQGFYWSINLILSIICFIAVVYFEYFGSIIIYTSIFQAKQAGDVSASIKALIKPQDFLFFTDFIVAFLFYLVSKKLTKLKKPLLRPLFVQNKTWFVLAVVCISFTILSNKMDKDFTNELVRADQLGVLNYELNTFLLRNQNSFTDLTEAKTAIAEAQAETVTESTDKLFGTQKGKNLIVIQLEAFQNFPINLSLNNTEVTPVLNNLAKDGYYFPHIFQQIGQGNTSDAEFMSNTSIYPTGTIAMSTGYGDRDIPSLPKLLEKQGYEADTFHVNDVTFWDRIKLYPALGFTHFFDKPFYKNDNFNTLGASDEELYRVGLEKITAISKQNKPFYAQFITLSSHHPFKIPVENQNKALRDSLTRSQLGDYLLAINYTDYALGVFIDGLKKAGLWENTVLVVYGDHFGLQPKENTNTAEAIYKAIGVKYHPDISRFNIPLFIHAPNLQKGEVINQVGGQMDIMPTISNLLGISLKEENFVHFGQDLMNIKKNVFGMRYYLPTGSFFNDDIMFVPGKGFADGKATSLTTLEPVTDFSMYKDDYDYVLNQMKLSDDYVNMLPKR
ncbi:LTA synthase family protein [Paenibacillus psychroresistens]|uniref:LTA synthase family protein n=2 Tax=Paenibacillus psychroresistens TaxID=1778678 RepID=A0A6B8RUP7_9BACL|nr:LTA synthase family protein [Paenibacillus psychroresistens]